MKIPAIAPPLRVLLLCEDPLASHLLRTLLRALPGRRAQIVEATPGADDTPSLARDCTHCFLDPDLGGMPLQRRVRELRQAAPGIRIHCVLSEESSHGDRLALARALDAGVEGLFSLSDLSLQALADALDGKARTQSHRDALQPAGVPAPRARTTLPDFGHESAPMPDSGSWRISLREQRACFDEQSLRALGYVPSSLGDGIGDWKALIHPDDVDRLVQELQRLLDEDATPYRVNYRLRTADGSWVAVVSDDISVQSGSDGEPQAITGRFYRDGSDSGQAVDVQAQPRNMASAGSHGPERSILEHCQTAIVVYRRDAQGTFRVEWCNAAAAQLEQREIGQMRGLRAAQASPPFNGFELEAALARVHETTIAEVHELMELARSDHARWRRLRISRLPDLGLLCEMDDISEHANARSTRRLQDEMAQHVMRSLPITTLLVDELGRIVQCVALASTDLAGDGAALENSSIAELLGEGAGNDCLQQVNRTINTGRTCNVVYAVGTESNRRWLECNTAILRARPGMPQRVVLTLQDASQRVREAEQLRASREQLKSALRHIPLALYLKDLEGRYQALNPAFESLMGIEQSALLGKTDYEVFPDELATAIHEEDRRTLESTRATTSLRIVGQGIQRGEHYCFQFPWFSPDGRLLGSGGVWISPGEIPRPVAASPKQSVAIQPDTESGSAIETAANSVISRVEDALTGSGDYADVLNQLERLVASTTRARNLIHQLNTGGEEGSARALIAPEPLLEEILALERMLIPAAARIEHRVDGTLPLVHCDPVVFHQILLRAIRHARLSLGDRGHISIVLRPGAPGHQSCVSCREGFVGQHVELVIEDSDSHLSGEEQQSLALAAAGQAGGEGPGQEFAEIHALVHAQGGHLQLRQMLPSGVSLHLFLRAAEPEAAGSGTSAARSTVTPFTRDRGWQQKNP